MKKKVNALILVCALLFQSISVYAEESQKTISENFAYNVEEESISDLEGDEKNFESSQNDQRNEKSDSIQNQGIITDSASDSEFRYTFSLPSKESEKWIPINVKNAGSSVSLLFESNLETLEAPISLGIKKNNGDSEDSWYWEIGISLHANQAFNNLQEVNCYFDEAGDYQLMICNASHINDLYYEGVNNTPFSVTGKIIDGDTYEVNNSKQQATNLKSSENITCTLNGQQDTDYFVMEVVDTDIPLQLKIIPQSGVETGCFDSSLCYRLFRVAGDEEEIIASTMGNYASGATIYPIEETFTLKEQGVYYLEVTNASNINSLYYDFGDNKTPFTIQCEYWGKDRLPEYSDEVEQEISDLELFRKYPNYLNNAYVTRIESYINGNITDASYDIKGGEFGVAYKNALYSGGVNTILQDILAKYGLGKSEYQKCRDQITREYIYEICNQEDYLEEAFNLSAKTLKGTQDILKVEKIITQEKMIANLSNNFQVSEKDIKTLIEETDKEWKKISKKFEQGGKTIKFGELIVSSLFVYQLERDILTDLQSKVPVHSELWKALDEYTLSYEEKVGEDIFYYLIEESLDEFVSELDSKMTQWIYDVALGKTPSSGVIEVAQIATKGIAKLIPAASLDKTVGAITRHMYTDTIKSGVIYNMIGEFIQDSQDGVSIEVTEKKIKDYEKFYNLYLSLIKSDIAAMREITGENGRLLLDFAENALNDYSYREYINWCKRAVLEGEKSGLRYSSVGEYAIVTGKGEKNTKQAEKNLFIPKSIQNKNVLVVGENSFKDYADIETLYIDEGVEVIKAGAFQNCTNLKNIYLPKSIKKIENRAFSGCIQLENVAVDGNIVSLGEEVFENTNIKCIKANSDELRKYAEKNNIIYIENKNKVTYLEILQKPKKVQYKITDENIDLDGLIIEAWYEDGTSKIIDDLSLILPVFGDRLSVNSNVKLYYGDAQTEYNIEIEQIPTTYEINYISESGEQILDPIIKNCTTGESVDTVNIEDLITEIKGYSYDTYSVTNEIFNINNNKIYIIYKDESPHWIDVEGGQNQTVQLGELGQFNVKGYRFDEKEITQPTEWEVVSGNDLISIDDNGIYNVGNKPGKAQIKVTMGHREKTIDVIIGDTIPVVGVDIVEDDLQINRKQNVRLNYKVNPENVTEKYNIFWESSNPKVVEVDEMSGDIYGRSAGEARVTLTIKTETNEYSDSIEISVNENSLTKKMIEDCKIITQKGDDDNPLYVNQKEYAEISPNIDTIINQNKITDDIVITWYSDDPHIVQVNQQTGEISAIAQGNIKIHAEIKATNGMGETQSFKISKNIFVSLAEQGELYFDKLITEMAVGTEYVLKVYYQGKEEFDPDMVTWTSSDNEVIDVQKGVLYAKKVGEADIVAEFDGIRTVCNIKVFEAEENDKIVNVEANENLTPENIKNTVDTGDNSNKVELFIVLMIASILIMIWSKKRLKKQDTL